MEKLTERNYMILREGAKMLGSWTEAYDYGYESFYTDEAETIKDFCQWLEKINAEDRAKGLEDYECRSMGIANYEQRFAEYLAFKKANLNAFLESFVEEMVDKATGIDYSAELFRKR